MFVTLDIHIAACRRTQHERKISHVSNISPVCPERSVSEVEGWTAILVMACMKIGIIQYWLWQEIISFMLS